MRLNGNSRRSRVEAKSLDGAVLAEIARSLFGIPGLP